ncbi:MAG: alpha/beta hydrolase [Anaerolineaceae bacterium]|nr:alpha/beta hydrolase [Anaerolineaceae bacterium]
METYQKHNSSLSTTHKHAQTKFVDISGVKFAYRELGQDTGVPVIFLNHLTGNLDTYDPRIVDGIAAKRRIITLDNRGVGASEGTTPGTVAAMARDAVAFIRALGFEQVDLLGFSLGGFITQVIVQEEPQLIRKIVLAGTGPAGGVGIDKVTSITLRDIAKGILTFKDPKYYLFFTRTSNGRKAARQFLKRLKERTHNRDKATSLKAISSQLKAITAWGQQKPSDLSGILHPALVVNGETDKMILSSNSVDLAQRLPNAELILYPDAGHGGLSQYHEAFVEKVLEFFER